MKRIIVCCAAIAFWAFSAAEVNACTGISLFSQDGSRVVARTVEWAATPMNCGYVIVPRDYKHKSLTPTGQNGLEYKSIYGYTGLYTEYEPFIVEGINEMGLSAGLFFFPGYGEYTQYDTSNNDKTLSDMQFVSWVLSQFSTIDQVKEAISKINIVSLDERIGTVHWRIVEPNGRMVVLEFVDGVANFYENKIGVLTNAPGFQWHLTNLNNYVNIYPGVAPENEIQPGTVLKSLGHGSAMLGLPGDYTSPSRFVRAVFYQTSAPILPTGKETVLQAFHILNNFDIPIGTQHERKDIPENMQSATQFTTVTNQSAKKLYYRTAYNSNIRCIDLADINFSKVKYQVHPLDENQEQPIEYVIVR